MTESIEEMRVFSREILNIDERDGVIFTRNGVEMLLGRKDQDIQRLRLDFNPKKVGFKGYLGSCGIVSIKSRNGEPKAFLHGYFTQSLEQLLKVTSDYLKNDKSVFDIDFYYAYDSLLPKYEKSLRTFSQDMKRKFKISLHKMDNGEVNIEM